MEREEAQRYNNELFNLIGVKYKVNSMRDYYQVKLLYELMTIFKQEDIEEYFSVLLDEYYSITDINIKEVHDESKSKTLEEYFFGYGYTEGLYKFWYKYYNPTVMNFVTFLALYSGEDLPYDTFLNTTNASFNKMIHYLEEESVEMIRKEMSEIARISKRFEEQLHYTVELTWHTRHDEKVCPICKALDKRIFKYTPDKAHNNCRCYLTMRKYYHG